MSFDLRRWRIIISPEAGADLALMPRSQRWLAHGLIDLLADGRADECPQVFFALETPNRQVSVEVEVAAPFFVVLRVVVGVEPTWT